MIVQDLRSSFDALFTPEATLATAPMLALAVGVALFLVADILDFLRPARPLAFVGSILVALFLELRILDAPLAHPVLQGTFFADRDTALWGVLFLLSALFAWVYAIGYYRAENRPFKPEHDALMLSAPIGMMLMVGANDLVVFFVGLELLSIPLYALAAFRRARADSVEAGLKYFLLGSFSSAIFLYGAALLYGVAGTVGLDGLMAADLSSKMAVTGLALVSASLFFKASIFPFHLWVPDVYQGSPTPVTILMATGTKAAAFGFLVLRAAPLLPENGAMIVAAVALITMALGNLGALVQEDVKRMLAYSSVAHAGTLLLVVAAAMAGAPASETAQAALFYLAAYLFTATGAFGILSLLESDGAHFSKLESLRGLSRSRPGTSALLTLFLLSLGGIPATGGFLGKWFVFATLVRADMIGVAVIGVLLSVVALGYYLRVVVAMYMQPAPEGLAAPRTQRLVTAGLATAICGACVLLLGLFPAGLLDRMTGS